MLQRQIHSYKWSKSEVHGSKGQNQKSALNAGLSPERFMYIDVENSGDGVKKVLNVNNILVLATNFSSRYSGVTSTLEGTVRHQLKDIPIAIIGKQRNKLLPFISTKNLVYIWRKPKNEKFRIWHARRNSEMFIGLLFKSLLRAPIKLVFTSAAQRRHTSFTRFLISRMDAVIATSAEAAIYLSRPSVLIKHGVDSEIFHPAENRTSLRANMELPDGTLVGCFGRIREEKGVDLFVEAILPILKRHASVYAVVCGLTKPEHKQYEQKIRANIADHGLTDRFLLLGEQPPEKLPLLFRAMDVYVAPQRWEGYGVTPLEAMASGVPVVATDVGAFTDQIEDGVTGSIVPRCDVDRLSGAIERLIEAPNLRKSMGRAGRTRMIKKFDIALEANAINDLYRKLWSEN